MGSKGLGVMVTLELYKQNLDSLLERNISENHSTSKDTMISLT